MGKKYLDTKKNSIEDAVLKVWKKTIGIKIEEDKKDKKDKKEEIKESVQESGHTDVASMKTQVQIAMEALQKMNTELAKLNDEDDLPTWWTNKVATAVNKLDGMADYISAKGKTT
jgi:hypothetical protein